MQVLKHINLPKYVTGGSSILGLYENSPSKMLLSLFPDHPWDIFLFRKKPQNFWDSKANRLSHIKTLERSLGIKNWWDWYHIASSDMIEKGSLYFSYSFIIVYRGS